MPIINNHLSIINQKGIPPGDPRCTTGHLPLGRIATRDWSNRRVLDRMLLYERRIKSSLYKTMNELERRRLIRVIEHQDADQQQLAPAQAIPKRGTGFQPVENMAKMAMPLDQTIPKACGFEAATLSRPSPSLRDEAATQCRPAEKKGYLKKQSVRQGKLVQFSR